MSIEVARDPSVREKRTQVGMPPDVYEQLRVLAFQRRVSMAQLIRDALENYLEAQQALGKNR